MASREFTKTHLSTLAVRDFGFDPRGSRFKDQETVEISPTLSE